MPNCIGHASWAPLDSRERRVDQSPVGCFNAHVAARHVLVDNAVRGLQLAAAALGAQVAILISEVHELSAERVCGSEQGAVGSQFVCVCVAGYGGSKHKGLEERTRQVSLPSHANRRIE